MSEIAPSCAESAAMTRLTTYLRDAEGERLTPEHTMSIIALAATYAEAARQTNRDRTRANSSN